MGTVNTDQIPPHTCIKNLFFFFKWNKLGAMCSLPVKNDIKTWSRKESTSKSEETSLQIMQDTWSIHNVFNKESISWSHTSNFTDKNTVLSHLKPGTTKKNLNPCSQANHWCYGQRLHKVYHGWHFILNFPHSCNSHVTPFILFRKS